MYGEKQLSIDEFFQFPVDYEELVRGFFGLNYMEFIVLCSLNQVGEGDTDEISEQCGDGWPRNKINAALKKLTDLHLCQREKYSPETQSRGYKYMYTSISAGEIADRIMASVEEFVLGAKKELSNLEYHLKAVDTRAYKRRKSKRDKLRKEWLPDKD